VKDLWGLYVSVLNVKIPDKTKTKREDEDSENSEDELSIIKDEEFSEEEDEDEDDNEVQPHKRREFRSDIQVLKRYPTLILSPLFSYLAIISLKLPISLNEIYQYPTPCLS
jgi:hypothetical protein